VASELLQGGDDLALKEFHAGAVVRRLGEVVDEVADTALLHILQARDDLLRGADGQRVLAVILGDEGCCLLLAQVGQHPRLDGTQALLHLGISVGDDDVVVRAAGDVVEVATDRSRVAAEHLRELRDFGVKVYLDDFGTGYSSLSHLHKLPVDALKIDRSFVRSLLLPERPAIVESILALARTLKTGVVAEGVESAMQAQELKRLGCRHAQGYFFSPPISSPRVEQMLADRKPLGQSDGAAEQLVRVGADLEQTRGPKPLEWPDEQPTSRSSQKSQGRVPSTSAWAH